MPRVVSLCHLRVPSRWLGRLPLGLEAVHVDVDAAVSIGIGPISQSRAFVVLPSAQFWPSSGLSEWLFGLLDAVTLRKSRVIVVIAVLNSHIHPILHVSLARAAQLTVVPDMVSLFTC